MGDKKSEKPKDNKIEDQKDVDEISEKIPAHLIKKIPLILKIIEDYEKDGLVHRKYRGERYFSGPLPPQVLEDLTEEQKNKIIDDMINSKNKHIDFQRDLLNNISKDKKNYRLFNIFKLIFISLFIGGIFIFSVLSNSKDTLKDFLPYIMMAFGGGGIALIYISSKKKKEKKEIEEFIDTNDTEE